jgi:hypothetical protein
VHTYIDLYFSPEGASPLTVAERLHAEAGLSYIVGEHDLVFEWSSVAEFRDRLGRVHRALQGTGVQYRIQSVLDDPTFIEPVPWPPPAPSAARPHPGYGPSREPPATGSRP